MGESEVTFAGPDGWAKGWILLNSVIPVSNSKQQGDGSMMI